MSKYDVELYRKLFPVTRVGTVYMNHAAVSPLSTRVVSAVKKYMRERSETWIENFSTMRTIVNETRSLAAKLLNDSPERIAFLDNTSNALNLLASGLKGSAETGSSLTMWNSRQTSIPF